MARKGAEHAAHIMDVLTISTRALSAYDLLDRLRSTGVAAPLTIYRALDKLMKSGKVHRIESLNAFVACKGSEHHRHAEAQGEAHQHIVGFTICDKCGLVDEFADAGLCSRISESLSSRSFVARGIALEVHGLCAACSAAT